MKIAQLVLLVVLGACASKQPTPPTTTSNARPADKAPSPTEGGPYDYRTWTAKLDDPNESERAVTELEQLGDPGAISALGEAWRAQGRPVRMLQVIVSVARPLTAAEAKAQFLTSFEKTGRAAHWSAAMPFLVDAIEQLDVANPRSVDAAIKAADAIGESHDPSGLDALVRIASLRPLKQMIAAQVAAIRALGTFSNEKKRAGIALMKIIDREPPPHPRNARSPAEARELEELFGLFLAQSGAAINAVGELRFAPAAKVLVLSMYRTPELFVQIRRALVTTGPGTKEQLRAILAGKHTEVNDLIAKGRLDQYCGDQGNSKCVPVSARDFYAAVSLGDFYDAASTPDLLAALAKPPLPVYYMDDQPSPYTQHNAIFDALRKLGAADAAVPVRALWTSEKTDLSTRILAVSAYPFLARDQVGVDELGAIAADNTADDSLRQEAATALARLSTSTKSIDLLTKLADKYFKAAADKKRAAEGKPKRDADAADKALDAKKTSLDKAKTDLLAVTNDASKTADEIRRATDSVRKLEDGYKEAKKKHREAVAPFKQLDSMSKAYKGFARMFQTHVARIEIAIRCKQDLTCFGSTLALTPDVSPRYLAPHLAPYIKDIDTWTQEEVAGLVEATIERAMLEIGKRGAAASGWTDALLGAASSDVRLIRQSVLLALPKIAKIPCDLCEQKLGAAIKAGEGKTTLGDLNIETAMVRNYFSWAGRTVGP